MRWRAIVQSAAEHPAQDAGGVAAKLSGQLIGVAPSLREAVEANSAIPTASTAKDYRAMATRDMQRNCKGIQVAGLEAE